MTPLARTFALVSLLALLPKTAPAERLVPDPVRSTVPACLVACPRGDLETVITVRDFSSNPIMGSTVVLDFSACPAFVHCQVSPSNPLPYTVDPLNRRVSAVTDAQGIARFPLQMGGHCDHATVTVTADGVLLQQPGYASPDQDGSLLVDAADVTLEQSKLGQADPSGDFDCDGIVTQADVDFVVAHKDHECPLTTPVGHSSWGRLKILYR